MTIGGFAQGNQSCSGVGARTIEKPSLMKFFIICNFVVIITLSLKETVVFEVLIIIEFDYVIITLICGPLGEISCFALAKVAQLYFVKI